MKQQQAAGEDEKRPIMHQRTRLNRWSVDFAVRRRAVRPLGIDFLAGDPPRTPLQKNVTITLNAPVDFIDPQSGRTWRMFQSGFDGPWKPGTRQFQAMAGKDRSRDQIYLSILTLSYDPGRALKYTGCLLIVLGIAVVYYMRIQGAVIRDWGLGIGGIIKTASGRR